jgi:hypothetical protein
MALPPLRLLENVAGKWDTEGSARVSVARESRMLALPPQRHEVASRLGEPARGLSASKKVTKIIVQEWLWHQRQNDATRCAWVCVSSIGVLAPQTRRHIVRVERLIPGRKVPLSTSSISSHNGERDLRSSIISCGRVRAVTHITHNMSSKGQQSLSALHRMAD